LTRRAASPDSPARRSQRPAPASDGRAPSTL
jgi:hypothetical protein